MGDISEVDILALIKKNLVVLILAALIVGGAAFGASFLLPNQYTASANMYLLAKVEKIEDGELVQKDDYSFTNTISSDVLTILTSARLKSRVAQELGMEGLGDYAIGVANAESTRIVDLNVTGPDPETAAKVANKAVECASEMAVEIMNVKALNLIDEVQVPTYPSGPNHLRFGYMGAAAGFTIVFVYAFMRAAMDTRVRDGRDVAELVGVPVVGHFNSLE